MHHDTFTPTDALAERSTRLLSQLDGVLDTRTLDALQGVWSTLESASVDGTSHARAVRERLFWQSFASAGTLPVYEYDADDWEGAQAA